MKKHRVFLLICILVVIILGIGFFHKVRERLFPAKYRFLVVLTSGKYNHDPLWIASIVFVESSFIPGAVSPSGAQGLMQIMPATSQEIIKKADVPARNDEDVFVPSINLEMGCWYLADLETVFDNRMLALIAYNAGRGNVQKWIDNNPDSDIMDKIAFSETREYVKRVKRTYAFLKILHTLWSFY